MECPACGRDNAEDRMECESCSALLVDAFEPEDNGNTDPIQVIGGSRSTSTETDELLRAAREITDDAHVPRESLERIQTPTQYTGDLPRLFTFGNRYQILEKLGEGGMGRVYKALDLELDRAVALKTIRTEKGSGSDVLERFKQELILARKVTHKNVIRIYDLGEDEGMKFFTMELVEGASLRDVLNDKKRLTVPETLSLMKQMLAGLAEAHSQGVVHRDLKPQNIMVDGSGVVRIMDFGIARTADSATMTGTSEMMGTPDYISPEQVKGETADAQSDLYSCGVILYELLTGETPFKGDTPISRIVARLQVKPKPPRELNPDIPPYLERIILKCLEADTDLRYESANEVLDDLAREQVDSSLWLRTKKSVSRRPGLTAAAVLAASLAAGFWYDASQPSPTASADVVTTSIAVLPFHNMTGADDLAWMESGIPDMVVTDISQLRSLRPVTAERIRQILVELGKEGQTDFDAETIKVVAELAGANFALHGSIVPSGGKLRLDLDLIDSETGLESRVKVEGEASEVFALVDTVTEKVTAALEVDETSRPLVEVSTDSLGAFRAYHQGLSELGGGANQAAIPLFEEAVELDPSFAMAYAKLAEAHFLAGNEADAREVIRAARSRIADSPPPRAELYQIHAIAARVEDDPETAVKSYQELEKLYPNDPQILFNLASSLETMGQIEDAVAKYREVLSLDPQFGGALLGLGRMLVVNRRPQEAVPILQQAVAAGEFEGDLETLGMIRSILGVAHRDLHEYDLALEELQQSLEYRRAANDHRGVAATLTNLARVYVARGQLEQARNLLNESLLVARESGNSTMESYALANLGVVYEQSGDLRAALASYSDSLEIEWERKEHTELIYRLNFIGNTYALLGRYADAMVYLEQAKVHITASNDAKGRAYNLYYVGKIYQAKGNYKEAFEAFLSSISLFQETGDLEQVAIVHEDLVELYIDQGRLDDARSSMNESLALSEELKIPWRVAQSRIQVARLALAEEQFEKAARALDEAEHSISGSGLAPHLTLIRGSLMRRQGRIEDAARLLSSTQNVSRERGALTLEVKASIELARARLDAKQIDSAAAILFDVIHAVERRRLRPLLSEALLTRARVSVARGESLDALEDIEKARDIATAFDGRRMMDEAEHLMSVLGASVDGQ